MPPPLAIDPSRRRRVRSLPLIVSVAVALAGLLALGPASLLWSVHHPVALVLAFPAGHLAFALSVLITRRSPKMTWYATKGSVLCLYRPYGGETMLFYLLIAFAEEVLFRALPLSHWEGTWWQILGLATAFSLVHGRKIRQAPMLFVDYLVLGALLGIAFVWLQDLWPIVIVHAVRNASVAKVFMRKADVAKRDAGA